MLGRFKMVTTVSEWSLISSDLSFKKNHQGVLLLFAFSSIQESGLFLV